MAARKKAIPKIYELLVELEDIQPLIWRLLLVPSTITLPRLHDLLQLVMGWTNSHFQSFEIGERSYSSADAELEELNMANEKKFTLATALGDSTKEFQYEYDFGDSWRLRVRVTTVAKPKMDWSYPLCVAGARASPPDDVGGVPGYLEFLAAIGNPNHDEHENMLGWIGGAFDPEGFDLNTINRTLRWARM